MDLPRKFTIRESSHRVHNPYSTEKLAVLGQALRISPGTTVLDLASGTGEMLCQWARDHGITGTGVDISTVFVQAAKERAVELGVAGQVSFLHGNAAGHVAPEPVDIAACLGATWIGGGVPGTIDLLRQSLRPGGILLIGEPFWRKDPPDEATVRGCHATSREQYRDLPGLVELFGDCGLDLVEMVLADEECWDRYVAAQWFNVRTWLDANPDDVLAGAMRAELTKAPLQHVRYQRPYLGWGVFALMAR